MYCENDFEAKEIDSLVKKDTLGKKDKLPSETDILKKIWKTKKLDDGSLEILKYAGTDQEVVLPSKIGRSMISNINPDAFRASKVKTLHIMHNTSIPMNTRWDCTIILDDAIRYIQKGDCIIAKDSNTVVYCNPNTSTELNIPEGIQVFNARVRETVTKIYFPESLKILRGDLGKSCVTEVTLPPNLDTVSLRFFNDNVKIIKTKAVINHLEKEPWTIDLDSVEIPDSELLNAILQGTENRTISGYRKGIKLLEKYRTKYDLLCIDYQSLMNSWINTQGEKILLKSGLYASKYRYSSPRPSTDSEFNGKIDINVINNIIDDYCEFVCNLHEKSAVCLSDKSELKQYLLRNIAGELNIDDTLGLDYPTALIALAEIYGTITQCEVPFDHDKLEANGEYSCGEKKVYYLGEIGIVETDVWGYDAYEM